MLEVRQLTVGLTQDTGCVELVSGVTFSVEAGKIRALVGGSGSGKSTSALAVMRLLGPGLSITGGQVILNGTDITRVSPEEMRRLRGGVMGMVFQEPLSALNPVLTIGQQIEEVLKVHTPLSAERRHSRAQELLRLAGITDPSRVVASFPHQLSGGMRQRAMIAQAVAGGPQLLIADEPTSNLDVTLQARILDLFRQLRKDLNLAILIITHDLGLVKHLADEVSVMNAGTVVESGPVDQVLSHPGHDYTRQLVSVLETP